MDAPDASRALSALGLETRLTIVDLLVASGPGGMAVSEIATALGTSKGTVSAQLKVLAAARLVAAERHGKQQIYRVDRDLLRALGERLIGA